MKTYLVRFDGGSRGNPGVSGSGAVLYSPDGRLLSEASVYVGPQSTNNVAEFEGLIVGLRMAIAHRVGCLRAEGDSELIIKQMNGVYRVRKPHLVPLYQKVRNMADRFDFIEFVHIERAKNHVADALANKAMDERRTRLPSIFRGLDAVEAGEEEEDEGASGRRDFASLYNGGELRYSYGFGDTIEAHNSTLRPLTSKKRDLSVMNGHSSSFASAMAESSRVSPSSPDIPMEKRPRSCEAEAPFCTCRKPSVKRCVKKEGKNKGRFFYACASTKLRCEFFQWMDDDDEIAHTSQKKQGKRKKLIRKESGNEPSASDIVCGSGVTEKEKELFCGTCVRLRPEHDGGMRVSYPYHPDRNEALKKRLPGYKWLPETKEWFCPDYSVPILRSFLLSVDIPFPW